MGEIQKVAFSIGLAKGLEIAEGFAVWIRDKGFNSVRIEGNLLWSIGNGSPYKHTTAELLEIYLTENEKK